MDEASKHLRLHKNLEKTADAFGGHRLAESFSLKGPLPLLTLGQEEGVVPNGLHEEPDEHFRHQPIEGITFWKRKENLGGSGQEPANPNLVVSPSPQYSSQPEHLSVLETMSCVLAL